MLAVMRDHPQCVKELIKAGADVGIVGTDGLTPLMFAIENDQTQCVKKLIRGGADVNDVDFDGKTTLVAAIDRRNPTFVDLLIKAGADVNMKDNEGNAPLDIAVMEGSIECLKVLIDPGADVNWSDYDGVTALMRASRGGHYKCVDTLLEAGADVNATDNGGSTALNLVLYSWRITYYPQCIRRLLRAGIHINKFSRFEGKNALGMLDRKFLTIDIDRDKISHQNSVSILYAAGEKLEVVDVLDSPEGSDDGDTLDSDVDEENISEIQRFDDEKLILKNICRKAIRKHLLELDPHQNLFDRIPKLGLPLSLTSYLLFHLSLDDEEDSFSCLTPPIFISPSFVKLQ